MMYFFTRCADLVWEVVIWELTMRIPLDMYCSIARSREVLAGRTRWLREWSKKPLSNTMLLLLWNHTNSARDNSELCYLSVDTFSFIDTLLKL